MKEKEKERERVVCVRVRVCVWYFQTMAIIPLVPRWGGAEMAIFVFGTNERDSKIFPLTLVDV